MTPPTSSNVSYSCCLCLSNLEESQSVTVADNNGEEDTLSILGNVFSISEFFIDSLRRSSSSSPSKKRPGSGTPAPAALHCTECTISLKRLNGALSKEDDLKDSVLKLQTELCAKLRQLANVVHTIESERARIHQGILTSERQIQNSGKRKDELMSKEVQSLRQLVMGALLLSTDSKTSSSTSRIEFSNVKVCSAAQGYPAGFAVPETSCNGKELVGDTELKKPIKNDPLACIKVETDCIRPKDIRSGQDNEEVWNEFVILNEDAAEPIEPDEIIYEEEFDEDADDPISECGSEYIPPSKRQKHNSNSSKSLRRSSKSLGSSSSNKISHSPDSKLSKTLDTIASTLKRHGAILDSLVAERQLDTEGLPESGNSKKQSKLISILSQQARELSELKAQVGNHSLGIPNTDTVVSLPDYSTATHDFSQLPKLPVEDKAALDSLEEWVSQAENRELLVASLSLVGGPTLEKNIRRVLGKIFGKKLRTRVNLTGRGGKIAFGSLSLHQILLDTIRRQRPLALESAITVQISNWFRFSKSTLTPEERKEVETENSSVY